MQEIVVKQFQTSDGTIFEDRIQATRHQAALDAADEIGAYVAHVGGDPKAQTRLRNTLTSFVQWRAIEAA